MTFLLETDGGSLIPLHAVTSIGPRPSKAARDRGERDCRKVHVTGTDRPFDVPEYSITEMKDAPAQVWPAQPGIEMISYSASFVKDGAPPWRTPVIAWGMMRDGSISPITPDGVNDGLSSDEPVILLPNGIVIMPHTRSWRSLDEYLREIREMAAAEAAPDDSVPA